MKKIKLLILSAFISSGSIIAQNAGNALNFDATNGYVSTVLPTIFNAVPSNDFTIETWLLPNTSSTSKRVFFAQLDNANFVSILMNSSNVPYVFIMSGGSSYSVNTQTQLSSGIWSHFATTWDASTHTINCYINGVQTANISGGGSSTGNDNIMTIGARTDGNQLFKGSLDAFRIWSVIRTPCEIAGSMNSDFTVTQPSLVASYDFNNGIANGTNTGVTTLSELNGNYNGTLNGFLLSGTSSNWVNSGAGISQQNSNDGTTYLTDDETACDSFTWINNTTYTTSISGVTYSHTTTQGCPAESTLNLVVNNTIYHTDTIEACGSYTWIDNNNYTTSNNTATYTYPGGAVTGCDSVVTLNLNILQPSVGTDLVTACNAYTWINGVTYYADNTTATDTLTNAAGCDSIVTLNLTLYSADTSITTLSACQPYTWNGTTYASSGFYYFQTTGTHGCDSIAQLYLTINTPEVSITQTDAITLEATSSSTGLSYQWIDCATGQNIPGETNATFVANSNGSYAVTVSNGICDSTSACVVIDQLGIANQSSASFIRVFPNPVQNSFKITFTQVENANVYLYDTDGKLLANYASIQSGKEINLESMTSGVYLIHIETKAGIYVERLIKY